MRRLMQRKLLVLTIILSLFFLYSYRKGVIFYFEKDIEIGVLEGDENYMFGAIAKVDIDKDGNIYVLDPRFSKIQKYDEKGKFLFSLKIKKGEGPEEVHSIKSMAIAKNGYIWTLDMRSRKILIFNEKGSFVKSFKVDFDVTDILPYKENAILLGVRKDYILHEINNEGKIVKSFGEPFEVPGKYSQYKDIPVIHTPMRADISGNEIFIFNPHAYEIRVYENYKIKKTLKWKSEDFQPLFITKANVGIGIVFPTLSVLRYKNRIFVTIKSLKEKTMNNIDIFENYNYVNSLKVAGFPYVIDREGRFYFEEEEEFPKVIRYKVKIK